MTGPLVTTDTSDLSATLARHWNVQVRAVGDTTWTFIRGITSFNPTVSKTRQDAGDFHSGNWGASTGTEAAWSLEIQVLRKLDEDSDPDPGVEMCRAKDGELGTDEELEVRWWRSDALPDAYQGKASVDFSTAAGDKTALLGATITLNGVGARSSITKPAAVAVSAISVVPSVATIAVGETLELEVHDQAGNNVTQDCSFTSSNEARATVDDNGVVLGIATGAAATITATYPGVTPDTAAVTVA